MTGTVTEPLPLSPPSANVLDAPQTKHRGRLDRTHPIPEEHGDPVGSVRPGSARDGLAHPDDRASRVLGGAGRLIATVEPVLAPFGDASGHIDEAKCVCGVAPHRGGHSGVE